MRYEVAKLTAVCLSGTAVLAVLLLVCHPTAAGGPLPLSADEVSAAFAPINPISPPITTYAGGNRICPATLYFNGQISSRRSGQVRYRFYGSDGFSSPLYTLTFLNGLGGVRQVSVSRQIGVQGSLLAYQGWMVLQVAHAAGVQPWSRAVETARLPYTIQCTTRENIYGGALPVITSINYPGKCVALGNQFTILGNNFGTQEGKAVRISASSGYDAMPQVASWSNNQIVATLYESSPRYASALLQGQRFRVFIVSLSDPASRALSNYDKELLVCGISRPDLSLGRPPPTTVWEASGIWIGQRNKLVRTGYTLILTPEDASSFSADTATFPIRYTFSEINRIVDVPGPFKNKIYFASGFRGAPLGFTTGQVNEQTITAIGMGETRTIVTTVTLPVNRLWEASRQYGALRIVIDADNQVVESNEYNNVLPTDAFGIEFSGF